MVLSLKNKMMCIVLCLLLVSSCFFSSVALACCAPKRAEAAVPAAVPLLVSGATLGASLVALYSGLYGVDLSKQFSSLDEVASSFQSWAAGGISDVSSRDVLFGYLNTLGMTGYISTQALQAGEAGSYALALGWLKTLDKIVFSSSSSSDFGTLDMFSVPIVQPTRGEFNQIPADYVLIMVGGTSSYPSSLYSAGVSDLDSLSYSIQRSSSYNSLIVSTLSAGVIAQNSGGSSSSWAAVTNGRRQTVLEIRFNLDGSVVKSGMGLTVAALSVLGGTSGGTTDTVLSPDAINTGASDAQTQAIDGYFENQDADALKDALVDVLGSYDVSALTTNPDVLNPSTSESQVSSKPAGGLVIGGSDWAGSIVTGVRAGSVSLDAAIDAVLSALQSGVLSLTDAMALLATIAGAEVASLVTGFDGWTWENYTYELKNLKWASCFPLCLYWDCLEMFNNLNASGGWDYVIKWDTGLSVFGGYVIEFDVSAVKDLAPFVRACWCALAAVGFMYWFASTFVGAAVGADKKAEKDSSKTSKGGGD